MSLVAHYPLHEQSGRANDLSGGGRHGVINGGVSQGVAGKGGLTGYSFNGSDSYVDIPNFNQFSSYTMAAWVRVDDVTLRGDVVVLRANNANLIRSESVTEPPGEITFFHNTGSSNQIVYQGPIEQGEWYHLVQTWDGSTGRAYINGEFVGSVANSTVGTDGDDDGIGANYANDNNYLDGSVADVRIYDHPLSPREVKALCEQGGKGSAKPDGISRYKLDGDATDSWGANDGTNNGATFVEGKFNQAASLDGSSNYIQTGYYYDEPSTITVSAWVYRNSTGTPDSVLGARGTDSSETGASHMIARIRNDKFELSVDEPGSGNVQNIPSDTTISTGNWYHCVAVFDNPNDAATIYINGEKENVGTVSNLGRQDQGDLYIGAINNANVGDVSGHFDGIIEDVRIYPRTLSPQEVSAIYNGWSDLVSPPSDGVAYYPLDGDATDQWGANDGTVNGATVTGDAVRGRAYSFNGTGDYISIGDNGDFSGHDSFTVSIWAKINEQKYSGLIDSWDNNNDSDKKFSLFYRGGDSGTKVIRFQFRDDTGTLHSVDSAGSPPIGEWIHVTGVYDGNTSYFYLNGAIENTTDVGSVTLNTSTATPVNIGRVIDNYYLNGAVDEPRFYDRALSPNEVHQIYLHGTRGKDMRPELVKR